MSWKEELERAVKIDAVTDPEKLKNVISEDYEFLDQMARKITFAIHDVGFVKARHLFSYYWTDMSSGVEFNNQTSGYITFLKLEREMSTPFYTTMAILVTNHGLRIQSKYTYISKVVLMDDGPEETYHDILSLSLDELRTINDTNYINGVVDKVMDSYVGIYKRFLESIGKKID